MKKNQKIKKSYLSDNKTFNTFKNKKGDYYVKKFMTEMKN